MPTSASSRTRSDGSARRLPSARNRRRDPLWARLMVLFGALLMMASGGVIVGGKVLISAATSGIKQDDSMLGGAAASGGGKQIRGALNILMVGIDERTDQSEPSRADSIIIMHVPEAHDQAYLISIPRDLYVPIPALKGLKAAPESNKINAAFSYGNDKGGRSGGFQLLAETIRRLGGGLSFNAGAIVNFAGFQNLVKALGGVDMCLDLPTDSEHIGKNRKGELVPRYLNPGATPVHYNAGCQHLEAWQALDYVRQRYQFPNGDYDRARHQQQFLKAVLKKAKSQGMTNPTKAIPIMKAAGSALTVSTNGVDIADWAFTLRGVTDNEMVMLKTNAGKFNPKKLADGTEVEELSADSKLMLDALRQDTLGEFILAHPDFVSSDAAS